MEFLKTNLNENDIKTLNEIRICIGHGCNKVEDGEDSVGQWTLDALDSIGAILQYLLYKESQSEEYIEEELERLQMLTEY